MTPQKTKKANGGELAACLWNCTKAVICNDQKNMDEFQDRNRNTMIEAVNLLSCSKVWFDHEHDIIQTLNFDTGVSCLVHWTLSRFPAPTKLHVDLVI